MVTCQAVVEEENLFVWQQAEGFGTEVNEGLVCEVVKKSIILGGKKAQARGKQKWRQKA